MSGIQKSNSRYQSDIIVDLIKQFGFKQIALNPGASYRGLHDSLVNQGENDPPMMLCTHEKIAVQMAHGYARASGEPMIAIVHNLVGLLHAPMGVYYAYLDRAHNTYLENAFELGWPAAILLFSVIGGAFLVCVRGLRNRGRDWIYPAIAIAATVQIAIHSWFDFSLQMPAVAITYACILGVGCAQSYSSRIP